MNGLGKLKISTSSGLEPGTFQLYLLPYGNNCLFTESYEICKYTFCHKGRVLVNVRAGGIY
jgi:hypothetical protein